MFELRSTSHILRPGKRSVHFDLSGLIATFIVAIVLGCAGKAESGPPGESQTRFQPSNALPVFSVVAESLNLEEPPDAASSPIAISDSGVIILTTSNRTGDRMRMVDTTGKQLRTFANTGKGPGEVEIPAMVFAIEDRVMVYDMANLRLSEYTLTGKPLKSHQFDGAIFPFNISQDTIDYIHFSKLGHLELRRSSLSHETSRVLLDSHDSVFGANFLSQFENADQHRPTYPARTSSTHRIILGDPWHYSITEWDADHASLLTTFTRDLPPVRRTKSDVERELMSLRGYRDRAGRVIDQANMDVQRKQLERENLPYFFSIRGLKLDDAGRLLVVGALHDSATVDVFADSLFLGRIQLDCPGFVGSWDSNKEWAAFVCQNDLNPYVKVYRIH